MNTVNLIGRLTKEPEMKYTQNGKCFTRFTLAVARDFKNSKGETEADFINCISWGKLAEIVANNLGKGVLIGAVGRIQTSQFEGEDGKMVFLQDIVVEKVKFLEAKHSDITRKVDKALESMNENGFAVVDDYVILD